MHRRKNRFSTRVVIYVLFLLGFGLILQGCQGIFPINEEEQNEPKVPPLISASIDNPIDEPHKPNGADALTTIATQHALVVGIDDYQHLSDLQGAVNDALLLRDTLRRAQVQLPDKRVLLNAQATRTTFIDAWNDMLKQAKPGNTLIVAFSGHGGQQPDREPLDEKDNKDEILMFHDFHFKQSTQGYITDDELYGMFKEANAYNIVFVVDACHSSGMVRAPAQPPSGRFRHGGFLNIRSNAPLPLPELPTQGDDGNFLPHVTLITAVEFDSLQTPETTLDNKPHGALSWFFAQALTGQADNNQNGHLERDELNQFLQEKVSNEMNSLQKPKVWPRPDQQSVIALPSGAVFEPPSPHSSIADIAIFVENADSA